MARCHFPATSSAELANYQAFVTLRHRDRARTRDGFVETAGNVPALSQRCGDLRSAVVRVHVVGARRDVPRKNLRVPDDEIAAVGADVQAVRPRDVWVARLCVGGTNKFVNPTITSGLFRIVPRACLHMRLRVRRPLNKYEPLHRLISL